MNKVLVTLLAAAIGAAVIPVASANEVGQVDARPQAQAERAELSQAIVKKWSAFVEEVYQTDAKNWAAAMRPLFADVSLSTLRSAAAAGSFNGMNDALLREGALASNADMQSLLEPMTFGDADTDLIFVPIEPCRIIDTRVAGGPIAANTTRNFDVTAAATYAGQGGSATDCNGAGSAGSYAAAAINFTVVTPSAGGYITAFPYLTTQPLAATVNYGAGDVRGNYAVVKLDQGASASELSVYSFAQTHLVADIVGYYRNGNQPVFECVDSGQTIDTVAAGATQNTTAPACPAGYTQTATNCQSSTWQMPFVYFTNGVCSAQNNSGASASLRASRTCCRARIP